MSKVCNTMDLTFTNNCIGMYSTYCSSVLTGPGSIEFINPSGRSNTFLVVVLSKNNNFIRSDYVSSSDFNDYIFDFENRNYQIGNYEPKFSFKYTECKTLTGMEGIVGDLVNNSDNYFDTTFELAPFMILIITFVLAIYILSGFIRNIGKGRV